MEATYIVYGNQENVLMFGTAKKVAEETGGVIKHLYVSDKKLDEYKEQ